MAPSAARNAPRFRSTVKGTCYCCSNVGSVPLYPVGTDFGIKLVCATCCRDTYDVRPGFTRDGGRMRYPHEILEEKLAAIRKSLRLAQVAFTDGGNYLFGNNGLGDFFNVNGTDSNVEIKLSSKNNKQESYPDHQQDTGVNRIIAIFSVNLPVYEATKRRLDEAQVAYENRGIAFFFGRTPEAQFNLCIVNGKTEISVAVGENPTETYRDATVPGGFERIITLFGKRQSA